MGWGWLQRKWHLQGRWGNKLSLGLWVNPKATAVQQRQDCEAELGCHAIGRLSFKYRAFQVTSLNIQDDFSSKGQLIPNTSEKTRI